MTIQTLFIVLPGIVVILLGALLFWFFTRRYRRELGLQNEDQERSNNTSFIIGAFQEVTKQLKEKEKELERLKALAEQRADKFENYNENILQCVTSGVMTFDRECRLTTINRSAEEMLSFKRENTITKECRDLFGNSDISRAVHTTLENKKPSARMETVLDLHHGKLWLGFNTALLTDRQGDAIGVILSFSDLTEVKMLQEQMELRERLTALGEMSAGIAHELRNPMAVINGYLALLAKRSSAEHQVIIHNITTEIIGMNRIIGDLLAFARPASLNKTAINMKELLESCVTATSQAAGANANIVVELNLADGQARVDELLMKQALTNLVQNAIESMPGGGTLSVDLTFEGEIRIVIRDTGMGIPHDKINKIYLPFFTLKDKGVGMGLALTHKIVTSHGGRIEVESVEGRGTTFSIMLPIQQG